MWNKKMRYLTHGGERLKRRMEGQKKDVNFNVNFDVPSKHSITSGKIQG